MDGFGGFGTLERVEVELLTDAFRISGSVETRFGRVTDILNQLTATHLAVQQATISEHADPSGTLTAPLAMVDVDSILLLAAPGLTGGSSSDMRIEKRAVKAMFAMPPVRATGTIHVPMGSRPLDGLLNVTDRYLAMTDATITSGQYPELGRTLGAVAIRRDRAEVLLVADDERPDELLAEILDERTAEAWLRDEEAPEG